MEFVYESLPTLLGAASAAVPMLQSQRLHERELQKAVELHKEAIKQAAEFHEADRALAFGLHKDALQKQLDQHLESIQLTIEAARRENLRDVWAQKSRRAETLLVMSALMISGFFTLAVEGLPPQITWPPLVVCYAASMAVGFVCLFGALFITMKCQTRMSDYNIYNVRQLYSCGRAHESFESYYECHVKMPGKYGTMLFYVGSLALLCSTALLQFCRWTLGYANLTAGIVYVVFAACGLAFFILVSVFMDTKTRAHNSMNDAEAAEQDARQMDRGQMGDTPIKRVLSRVALGDSSEGSGSGGGGRGVFRRRKMPKVDSDAAERERRAFQRHLDGHATSGVARVESASSEVAPEHAVHPRRPGLGSVLKRRSRASVRPEAGATVAAAGGAAAAAADPGNLESTLSSTTRRQLLMSKRGSMRMDGLVDSHNGGGATLTREQVEIDMDQIFPPQPPPPPPLARGNTSLSSGNNNDDVGATDG